MKKKQALLASGLCLGLSAALLAGTTFAWFTDSVTNEDNRIQAGTLDVQLFNDGTEITNESQAIFAYNKWEPGYSTGANLSVKNNGTLAIKYELELQDVTTTQGIEDVIDVYVGGEKKGTLADFMHGEDLMAGTLSAGVATEEKQVKLAMQTTAGNQYQGATATFDILLKAAQTPEELDGFDNPNYDAEAPYEEITVDAGNDTAENGARLRSALDDAGANAVIYVEEGTYEFTEPLVATKPVHLVGDGNVELDFSDAVAPVEGGYNTNAALLVLSSHVTFENVTVYGNSGMGSVVNVEIDNVGDSGLADGNLTVSDELNHDFQWAVNEFAPEYKGVYEDVNFINCTFALKEAGTVGHGLFLESRYTVVDGCTFENIQAQHAVVKMEEDHTKVLGSTFTNCTGIQIAEYWCGAEGQGDGNEYPGHDFKCEEGWAGLTGEEYQAHLDYAASMGWNHGAEQG